ncbi:branched-chain amino acid ABC transporter permease [Geodermatophilus sp. TF02-6]|uniref:branched-chain amino acid ABC transporter permease n=1 Tax=Geodermatophilus sp. TF02-6 TaxID=2250575 RepID=UPI000DE96427|nr:branched-chain amino acid ABC transporter permease [Geodermatophilus sp. TF02-6]RBY82437.1 branched-chain amino acid ABC transporter permease [Geodermatophilus sp. TF02-6]
MTTTGTPSPGATRVGPARRPASAPLRVLTVVALVAGVIAIALIPLSATPYTNYQLSVVAAFAVAILGLNIVSGYAGQISLGQSAFMGLGAYAAAFGVTHGWPVVASFLLAALLPAVVGLVVAIPAVRLRGNALATVTIILPILAVPLAKRFSDITGGSEGLNVDWMHAPAGVGLDDDQWRYYVVVAIAAVLFLLGRNIVVGRIGRAFAVVRTNEAVASAMGISAHRYKVLAFTIASFYGGAAGFLYVAVVQFASPDLPNFLVAINMLAALVIGGFASLWGSVVAGFFYVYVPVFAGAVDPSRTNIFYGAALLLVLFIVPGGVSGGVSRLVRLLVGRLFGRRPPARDDDALTDPQPITSTQQDTAVPDASPDGLRSSVGPRKEVP